MFHFPEYASLLNIKIYEVHSQRFPHSEISGSKVVRHFPEAYRRHTASFIAIESQGIHPMLLLSYQESYKPRNVIIQVITKLREYSATACFILSRPVYDITKRHCALPYSGNRIVTGMKLSVIEVVQPILLNKKSPLRRDTQKQRLSLELPKCDMSVDTHTV